MSHTLHKSRNYGQFKFYDFNRSPSKSKIQAIKESLKRENRLDLFPILVKREGTSLFIVDGQHRFLACKDLHLDVVYAEIEGDIDRVMIDTNTTITPWRQEDYLNYFIKKGNPEYIKLKSMMEEYSLKFGVLLALHLSRDYTIFKNGLFKFDDRVILFLNDTRDFVKRLKSMLPEGRKQLLGNRDFHCCLYEFYRMKNFENGTGFKFTKLLDLLIDLGYQIPHFGSSAEYKKFFTDHYFKKVLRSKSPIHFYA